VTTYDKNHLFPTEIAYVKAGPFNPTSFTLDNFKFGLVICYEGFYPEATGDYSQFDKLIEDGTEVFLWSIGGTGVSAAMKAQASYLAEKFHRAMFASSCADPIKDPSVGLYNF
jgi:predicted amidohydrolase